MKTRVLLIMLCLACVASYAQTKKKKRPVRKPVATRQAPAPVQQAPSSTTTSAPAPPMDTTRRVAKAPLKPFDRPLDGYYKKTNILSAKVTPYPNLRESDVAFAKRIWREIDLREKMNKYLGSPKQRLIDVLMAAIAAGELTAYDANFDPKNGDPDGDGFSRPLTPGAARGRLSGDSTVVEKRDANNNIISSKMVAADYDPDSLFKFRLKEDWVFDKQRSIFEPRIIGIAPMVKIKGLGNIGDYQPAFWIYFPDARPLLATKEVASNDNDNTGLSFDDVFMKRIFTSYIVKESNDQDESIKYYKTGIDKLYEAERIKKTLMDWELNLWQY